LKALLIEEDCLKAMAVIPNNSINLILCDLPYGTTQNPWDSIIPLEELWLQYNRIITPNGAIILMSQGIFTAKLIISNEKDFKYKLAWEKSKATNFLNAKKQPLRKHEDICVFYSKQPTYNPQMTRGEPYNKGIRKKQLTGSYGDFKPAHIKSDGERYPTDVIYFKTAEAEGEVLHPTQKPVELARYLIKTYSKKGDVVLDNCFGSGSFLVAAALEGRDCIGIERNTDITMFKNKPVDLINIAERRLTTLTEVIINRKYDWDNIEEKMAYFWQNTPFSEHFTMVERLKSNDHYPRKQKPNNQRNSGFLVQI
jgi:DNA (cytosine-5-)-methyltransferase